MIIFDLDGTLWEKSKTTYESANTILRKNNIDKEVSVETEYSINDITELAELLGNI